MAGTRGVMWQFEANFLERCCKLGIFLLFVYSQNMQDDETKMLMFVVL